MSDKSVLWYRSVGTQMQCEQKSLYSLGKIKVHSTITSLDGLTKATRSQEKTNKRDTKMAYTK